MLFILVLSKKFPSVCIRIIKKAVKNSTENKSVYF